MIDRLRDHLWSLYGASIQSHLRDDLQHRDPRQLSISLDDDPPF